MVALHLPQGSNFVAEYADIVRSAEDDGYDAIWIGEVNQVDAPSAAAIAATHTDEAQIGVLLNTFTRSPTVLAMTAWTLAHLAPGRGNVVLGSASPLLVQRWNGIPYRGVYDRLRDSLRFLRSSFDGTRVEEDFATFTTSGFTLRPWAQPPPSLLLAACGPRALALAAEEADGVVLNWIAPSDLERIDPLPDDRSRVSLVVPVCPTEDRDAVDRTMRPIIADYLQAPAYADQQRRLGRGEELEEFWQAWAGGDRRRAHALLPASVLDALVVRGEPSECRRQLDEIERTTGVRAIATHFPPAGADFRSGALSQS